MNTCWKCGQELPEGQVECEDGCQPQALRELMAMSPSGMARTQKELADLAAEAELASILKEGHDAAEGLVRHLINMGAGCARVNVELNGEKFLVFVKRL